MDSISTAMRLRDLRMADYARDRARSDKVMPDARWVLKIACGWETEVASDRLDKEEATDLIANGIWRVAVRARSYGKFFVEYGHEFTIRSLRKNKQPTELAKILDGHGDWLLYGFLEGSEHRYFRIINLMAFRCGIAEHGVDAFSDGDRPNPKDNGETFFRAFDVYEFRNRGIRVCFMEGAC